MDLTGSSSINCLMGGRSNGILANLSHAVLKDKVKTTHNERSFSLISNRFNIDSVIY